MTDFSDYDDCVWIRMTSSRTWFGDGLEKNTIEKGSIIAGRSSSHDDFVDGLVEVWVEDSRGKSYMIIVHPSYFEILSPLELLALEAQ